MKLTSFVSFAGFIILIAATFCPLFRPLHIVNWDMYKANMPYGIVVLLISVVGILGVVLMQRKLVRLTAWLAVILVALFYVLSLLKIHYSFTFIPFHSFEKFMERQIKFKWGWWLLCIGPLFALFGALKDKPKYKAPVENTMDQKAAV
ncbi:MAG TPA: hypothetical protein VHE59_02125 [Mucilaginibacter sp.]|nr:hypothetical protein [Mucilaginibacter sp.]